MTATTVQYYPIKGVNSQNEVRRRVEQLEKRLRQQLEQAEAASSSSSSSSSGNGVTVACNFGASWTDKAQTVVTGQAWVAAGTEIVPAVKTPAGVDPDEMRLLDFKAVISDLVAGVGFTLTLYSETEAKGTYDVMCMGV